LISIATISHGNYETRVRPCTDVITPSPPVRTTRAVQALLDRTVLEANSSENMEISK